MYGVTQFPHRHLVCFGVLGSGTTYGFLVMVYCSLDILKHKANNNINCDNIWSRMRTTVAHDLED